MANETSTRLKLEDFAEIMTIDDVAEYLKCSNASVYSLIKSNQIKAYKMGKAWRISRDNLIEYLKNVGLIAG